MFSDRAHILHSRRAVFSSGYNPASKRSSRRYAPKVTAEPRPLMGISSCLLVVQSCNVKKTRRRRRARIVSSWHAFSVDETKARGYARAKPENSSRMCSAVSAVRDFFSQATLYTEGKKMVRSISRYLRRPVGNAETQKGSCKLD